MYDSNAQRRYFNANRDKLEKQGVDVDEWNRSSKGAKLPERKSPKPRRMKSFGRRVAEQG